MEELFKYFAKDFDSLVEYIAATPSIHNDAKKYIAKLKKEKIKKDLYDKYNAGAKTASRI